MRNHVQDLLESDVEALGFYASRSVDLRASDLHRALGNLTTPSVTVIGYGDGVRPGQVSIVVEELARTALRSGRSVELTSGREWGGVVRASAMVGRQAVASLPSDREVDAHKMLGEMASAGGSLVVRGLDDLPVPGTSRPPAVVDLWLVDDVAGVEEATGVDQALTLDVSPMGLRRLSRQKMCAVVATVDWRLTQRWRWEREADAVVEVGVDEDGRAVLGDGHDPVRLPPGL